MCEHQKFAARWVVTFVMGRLRPTRECVTQTVTHNGRMNTRGVGWLLVGVQFALFVLLVFLPWDPHGAWWVGLGAAVIVAGVVLGTAAFIRLGDALTPTPVPKADIELRTHGAYRWVRHPVYSAILLGVAGANIAAGTPATALALVVLVVFFWLKSRWEDSLLRARFGASWEDWAAHTGALAPGIGLWRG